MPDTTVRPERTFEQFSRGAELVRTIRARWEEWDRLPRSTWPQTLHANQTIQEGVEALMAEFDLTYPEWHYWAKQAKGAR